MPYRLIRSLAKGSPLSIVWPCYIAIGGVAFGLFSIPSKGAAIVLIPMFLISGLVIGFGMITYARRESRECARYIIVVGLALMILASWTRAFSVWGIDQQGAGSNIIATVCWLWITAGLMLFLIALWLRGLH